MRLLFTRKKKKKKKKKKRKRKKTQTWGNAQSKRYQCKLVKTFANSANDLKFLIYFNPKISLFRASLSLHISSQTKPLSSSLSLSVSVSHSILTLYLTAVVLSFSVIFGVGLVVCLQGRRGSDSLVVFLKHELKYSFILQRFLKTQKGKFLS